MRLKRFNNLPLNTSTPNFVTIFVFFGTALSFIEWISFSEIEAKREAILFLFGCSEVNSTWIIISGLANQRAPKELFTCVVYTNCWYVIVRGPSYSCNCSRRSNKKVNVLNMVFANCDHSTSWCTGWKKEPPYTDRSLLPGAFISHTSPLSQPFPMKSYL